LRMQHIISNRILSTTVGLLFITNLMGQWYKENFIIGTFFDPAIELMDNVLDSDKYLKNVELAQDAYFNLFTGVGVSLDMKEYLKLVNIHDSLGIFTLYSLRYGFSSFNSRFGQGNSYNLEKSNIEGWNLKDEPHISESDTLLNLANYYYKKASDKLVYVNLLPIYGFETKPEYEDYLDAYLTDTTLKVASFDFYPFHETYFQGTYFTNLQMITERAKDRPVWVCPLTVKHATYLDPERYHLYFMVFGPLAYGIKGITYYTYETIKKSESNYVYENALIDTLSTPTSKYFIVKDINRFVSQLAGPVIMNSTRIGTYHVSEAPFDLEPLDQKYLLNDMTPLISTISNTNILTGVFRSNADPSSYYLFMHNKNDQSYSNIYVSLKGNHHNNISVSAPVEEFASAKDTFNLPDTYYNSTYNETSFYVDFKPGELRIVKVMGVDSLLIKRSDYNLEISVAPNPVYDLIETRFVLAGNSSISLNLVSQNGTLAKGLLSNNYLNKGTHARSFNISGVNKGVYIVQLVAGGKTASCKILKF